MGSKFKKEMKQNKIRRIWKRERDAMRNKFPSEPPEVLLIIDDFEKHDLVNYQSAEIAPCRQCNRQTIVWSGESGEKDCCLQCDSTPFEEAIQFCMVAGPTLDAVSEPVADLLAQGEDPQLIADVMNAAWNVGDFFTKEKVIELSKEIKDDG